MSTTPLGQGPCLIGATGGSGTRAFARIVRRAGLYIGTNLNVSEDAVDLGAYSDRWINTVMEARASALPVGVEAEMRRDLDAVLARHLEPLAGTRRPWGWKEPRSVYLLPLFHERFPALRFLHVVRDGRDMAYSSNQNQLGTHGDTLLGPAAAGWPQPVRSAALWSRLDLLTADYGERSLAGRYLRVRFEDLCADHHRHQGGRSAAFCAPWGTAGRAENGRYVDYPPRREKCRCILDAPRPFLVAATMRPSEPQLVTESA